MQNIINERIAANTPIDQDATVIASNPGSYLNFWNRTNGSGWARILGWVLVWQVLIPAIAVLIFYILYKMGVQCSVDFVKIFNETQCCKQCCKPRTSKKNSTSTTTTTKKTTTTTTSTPTEEGVPEQGVIQQQQGENALIHTQTTTDDMLEQQYSEEWKQMQRRQDQESDDSKFDLSDDLDPVNEVDGELNLLIPSQDTQGKLRRTRRVTKTTTHTLEKVKGKRGRPKGSKAQHKGFTRVE